MNRKNKHNLTEHIRAVLQDHEEPYILGSWERFQKQKNRRENIYTGKKFFSIAASILLFLSFVFTWSDVEHTVLDQGVEEHFPQKPDIAEDITIPHPLVSLDSLGLEQDDGPSGETFGDEPFAGDLQPIGETSSLTEGLSPVLRKRVRQQTLQKIHPDFLADLPEQSDSDTARAGFAGIHSPYKPHQKASTGGRYVQKTDILNAARGAGERSVEFSLAYAPIMNYHDAQTDWGVGGGFYTDWNFTDKMAISSGLFLAQNKLKYDYEQGNFSGMQGSPSGKMEEETIRATEGDLAFMQVDLVSMEIPLNLRYSITDHLSVSAGISSVAFMKEHYDYTFEYQQQIQVFNVQEGTRLEHETQITTFTESQQHEEPSFNGLDLAALYTFSIGYHYDIAGRHKVLFEPFLKMPTGRMTSRNLKYTTGGLQLKIFL
ncbi:MAG: hypothetical protein WEB89_03300 [Balneolales bacterium]